MSLNTTINIVSRRYDFKIKKKWKCFAIEFNPPQLLCLGRFENEINHQHLGRIPKNTVSLESFWSDRYYNLFAFYSPNLQIRNLYFNLCLPPQISPEAVDFVDLDIDVVVWPDGSVVVLDQDEFKANSSLYGYPLELKTIVNRTISDISAWVKSSDISILIKCVFPDISNPDSLVKLAKTFEY